MITRESIETAYSFMHQKLRVYAGSSLDWQRDDIEYAIGTYVDDMSAGLYERISGGRSDFLKDYSRFGSDLEQAVDMLERMLSDV